MKYLLYLALLLSVVTAHGQQISIGIISDYRDSSNLRLIYNRIIREIDQTTGSSRKVVLGQLVPEVSTPAEAQKAYSELSTQSDLILTIGSISAKGLSSLEYLPKPVMALGVIDPVLQDISYKNGMSGKNNFTYIWQTRNLEHEIHAFYRLHNFKSIAIFFDEKAASTINASKAQILIDSISRSLNAQLTVVPLGENSDDAIGRIPKEVDAVYFTSLLSQPEALLKQLISGLNNRSIPTFTGNSRLIDWGVLASLTNENNSEQVIRKLAISTDEILSGSDLATMPVRFSSKENLYINLETARAIQLPIPFEVLFTATLIGDDRADIRTYAFEEIAERAIKENLNIQLSYQDIEVSELDIKAARANLLPALDLGFTGSQINEERATAAFNSPERSLTGDLTFSQLIYSEQAIAGLKITQYLKKAQEYNTEAEVLNILLDTYTAYLNILSAKTNVLIQQENLENTKRNKELAEIRVNIGSSNNADLYRWESELALASQSVVEAQASLMSVKLQMKNLLANTLEDEFDIADVSLQDEWFTSLSRGAIGDVVKTPQSLKLVSDFLVAESQLRNPNKKALLENINASSRQLKQNKRLLYVPTIAFQAQTSQVLARGGAGSTIDAQAQALGISEFQDNSWFAGVSLNYPIFSGLGRKATIQQSKISLSQLDKSKTLLDQNLELGVRSNVFSLLSASTNIRFSNEASQSAQKNFGLVQENYKQGQVTITQLIDAQEAALQARLGAAISIYEYLQNFLQLEFNVGAFTMLMTEDQLQDFNRRLQEYLNKQK